MRTHRSREPFNTKMKTGNRTMAEPMALHSTLDLSKGDAGRISSSIDGKVIHLRLQAAQIIPNRSPKHLMIWSQHWTDLVFSSWAAPAILVRPSSILAHQHDAEFDTQLQRKARARQRWRAVAQFPNDCPPRELFINKRNTEFWRESMANDQRERVPPLVSGRQTPVAKPIYMGHRDKTSGDQACRDKKALRHCRATGWSKVSTGSTASSDWPATAPDPERTTGRHTTYDALQIDGQRQFFQVPLA